MEGPRHERYRQNPQPHRRIGACRRLMAPCACARASARHPPVAQGARERTAVALVGIGGSLIYALQTRDPGESEDELYSTDNRATADGFAGLPRDYTGPVLGPPYREISADR